MEIRWIQRFENFRSANSNLLETQYCIKKEGLNKIYIMALIQAYEMSFELAWKTLKDYLEYYGKIVENPRSAIKEAFSEKLIQDGQIWIEMMEARNKTSHTYREDFAKQTAENILNLYIPQLKNLEKVLEIKTNE
ncbi:nucleotidyltransferase substrate binding protein [bacterium]|nr:nucleotidyltransferase substrate binding protein [bacterium]